MHSANYAILNMTKSLREGDLTSRMTEKRAAWLQLALIVVGCAIGAASYPLFLEPSHIAPGGITGLTTILNFHFGLPIGLTSLALNIPLLILGWKVSGLKFVIRTIFATILFSSLIDLMAFKPVSIDPMLSSVFGGVILGAGIALIMRGGATTGGTDLLARVVHKKFPAISTGAFLFALDFVVIILAWIFMSAQHAMYAIICVYISARVLDKVLSSIGTDKACHILSAQWEKIASRLMKELERGVTILPATGAYSGKESKMLVCVVGRLETMQVKRIVDHEDPFAFVYITDAHETLGEGFRKLSGEDQ